MSIRRAALGRFAELGDLYDARSDRFIKRSLLKTRPTEDQIDSLEIGEVDVKISKSGSLIDRSNSFGIDINSLISFHLGLSDVNKSDVPIDNDNPAAELLIYRINSCQEEIYLKRFRREMLDASSFLHECQQQIATHVVTSIDWGALCAITACGNESVNHDLSEQLLSAIKDALNGGSAGQESVDDSKLFSVKSNMAAINSSSFLSHREAFKLANDLASEVKNSEGGKGRPMVYEMQPLSKVLKLYKIDLNDQTAANISFSDVKVDCLQKCILIYEEIQQACMRYSSFYQTVQASDNIPESTKNKVQATWNEIVSVQADSKNQFRATILNARRGGQFKDDEELQKLYADLIDKQSLANERENVFLSLNNQIKKEKELMDQGFVILTENNRAQFLRPGLKSFVLYTKHISNCDNSAMFRSFFKLLQIHGQDHVFCIALNDSAESQNIQEKNGIHYYENGELHIANVEKLVTAEKSICFMELESRKDVKIVPKRTSIVRMMFHNQFFQSNNDHKPLWTCIKCYSHIEFGLDTKRFHCKCGRSNPKTAKFCADKILLYSNNRTQLLNMLCKLPESPEINILLLGETGVGKSTWINGIFNYFSYRDLKQAQKYDVNAAIASKFQFGGQTIQIGRRSQNENLSETGESCTQGPKLYPMIHDNYKINLIDTPGIGDSRGIEQDKTNFDNILSFLTNFNELHGVCVLLKPNQTRNSIWFRFCIEELLTHLHSSITENILFCFTNARSTFYEPGDTLPVLNEYFRNRKINLQAIPEKNCFCFDNEAFRYLAFLKSGVDDNMESRFELFDLSWNVARKETLRMLDYVIHRPPHNIAQTTSLNSAREVILQIGKPLAEMVNEIIPDNIDSAKRANEKLKNSKKEIGDLEAALKVEGRSFKVIQLKHPRTVCTGLGCWTMESCGIDGKESRKVYHQICHDKCTIKGLPTEAANDERLSRCAAFEGGSINLLMNLLGVENDWDIPDYSSTPCTDRKCNYVEGEYHTHFECDWNEVQRRLTQKQWQKYNQDFVDECEVCGHSYKLHMHITYDLQTVAEIFIKPDVQEKIKSKTTEKEKFEALTKEFELKIDELEKERQIIMDAQVTFGSFIKHNALIPYNDVFEELCKQHIKEEENKGDLKNAARLRQLTADQRNYRTKKAAIDAALRQSGTDSLEITAADLTADSILFRIGHLKSLKHSGQALKDALDGIIDAKRRHHTLMNLHHEEGANVGRPPIVLTENPKDGIIISSVKKIYRGFASFLGINSG